MGKKGGAPGLSLAKGVKKNANKQASPPVQSNRPGKPGFGKDAGSFLKHRLGQKVKNLRASADTGDDVDMDGAEKGAATIDGLQTEASRRGEEFAEYGEEDAGEELEEAGSVNANKEAENTRKRFYVELRKVLAAADIIIEVLDARDPGSCRSEALEREVTGAGKRLILLLNKIDLVPKEAVQAWISHLKRSHPAIAFKACHGGAHRATHAMTSASNAPDGLLRSTHAVVGADELMQLLKNYSRQGGTKTKAHVSVGVVGYPNTGKSSVINSMKRHSAVETGGRAGVTKIAQEVQLDSKITLIDSPGVVFEGASEDPAVVLRNVVRVENVVDPVGVVEALAVKAPRQALLDFYGLQRDFEHVSDFLVHVAQVRGKLKRVGGGGPAGLDLASAAKAVISDWTTGKFRYYVLPPSTSSEDAAKAEAETAQVVTSMAPAFDIDALFSGQGEDPAVLGAPREEEDDDDAMCDEDAGKVQVDVEGMRR
eukprot:TRINITY_DN38185_c0_g1_i1.p1 TRINITY_DN38185_c0_g1~~TRINITY_DN38185_c0_g1_i1.p1  ORF type:complete len:483 (+),score=138.80 TRINITY_DN38185_c0_g1_i1:30-1478(+)